MTFFLWTRLTWKSQSLLVVGWGTLLDHRKRPSKEEQRDRGLIETLTQVRNLSFEYMRLTLYTTAVRHSRDHCVTTPYSRWEHQPTSQEQSSSCPLEWEERSCERGSWSLMIWAAKFPFQFFIFVFSQVSCLIFSATHFYSSFKYISLSIWYLWLSELNCYLRTSSSLPANVLYDKCIWTVSCL